MTAKKFFIVVGTLLVLFYVITQPASAAGAVQSLLGMLQGVAESFGTFLNSLFE